MEIPPVHLRISFNRQIFDISILPSDTIAALKGLISAATGVAQPRQKLLGFPGGRIPREDAMISSLNMKDVRVPDLPRKDGQRLMLLEAPIPVNQPSTVITVQAKKPMSRYQWRRAGGKLCETDLRECSEFQLLPEELRFHVFSFLEPCDICVASRVSRDWAVALKDPFIWKPLYQNRWKIDYAIHPEVDWRKSFAMKITSEINMRSNLFDHVPVTRQWDATCLQMRLTSGSVVVGFGDSILREYDLKTGRQVRILKGHSTGASCVHVKGTCLLSGAGDGTILLWDLSKDPCSLPWNQHSYELAGSLKAHQGAVTCIQFDDAVTTLYTGGVDREIHMYDLNKGACIRTLVEHATAVTCLQFESNLLLSADDSQGIKVWDPRAATSTSQCTLTIEGGVEALQYRRELQTMVVCSHDTTTEWDCRVWKPLRRIADHGGNAIQYDDTFIIAGTDSGVQMYNYKTREVIRTSAGENTQVVALEYGNDCLCLALGNGPAILDYSRRRRRIRVPPATVDILDQLDAEAAEDA